MFRKMKLNSAIKRCKNKLELLEHKRTRSQAALVEALLTHTTPNDADVDYFNNYTEQIDAARAELKQLQDELASL